MQSKLVSKVMSNYDVAKNILDTLVLSLMKGMTPEYMKIAIDKGVHLYEFLSEKSDKLVDALKERMDEESFRKTAKVMLVVLSLTRAIVSNFKEPRERFTVERVFSWLKERRPDLAKVIEEHPEGMKWFREEILGLRKLLFGE